MIAYVRCIIPEKYEVCQLNITIDPFSIKNLNLMFFV